MSFTAFVRPVDPDYEALLSNLRRSGTPARVHNMELFLDPEIKEALVGRFDLARGLEPGGPWYAQLVEMRLQRFLGYDYVTSAVRNMDFVTGRCEAPDTAPSEQRRAARAWQEEHAGPIRSWADYEAYPWPDPSRADTRELEWYSENLPDDMCIVAGCHSVFEWVTWLMGYEGLCLALYDRADLVEALFQRVGGIHAGICRILLQFDRVKILFGGDDMGFKTQTMVSPQVLVKWPIKWHERMARAAHAAGKLYLLHTCGNLRAIIPDLIAAGIDGKHSFEDAVEPVTEAKARYGDRVSLIGGIDIDFLCRSGEGAIRARVRETLDKCMPGGGYCLGTGNTVANYIPVDNYLAMLDEGRRFGRSG